MRNIFSPFAAKQKPKAVSLRAATWRRGNLKGELYSFRLPKDIGLLRRFIIFFRLARVLWVLEMYALAF